MLSAEAELSLIQLLLFSPQLLLVFQISSSLFSLLFLFKNSPVVPSTVVFSPFLLLQSVVFLPHPQVFSNFFCCFTKILLFTFHNNIVLPYYCRSTRLLFFLQYSIVSFYDCIILFSQLCHLSFYSQLKFLHNALVLFPRIILSSSIRFCSSLTKLLFIYQCSIVFFHNSIV